MFDFVVKYFGPLKHIPLLPHLFDAGMKIAAFFSNRQLLDYMDDIEREVLSWQHTSLRVHKFGGTQFNINDRELGHIHGNGLLDVLFSRKMKAELSEKYPVKDHHIFKNSGWVSFHVQNEADKKVAIELLRYSYVAVCRKLN